MQRLENEMRCQLQKHHRSWVEEWAKTGKQGKRPMFQPQVTKLEQVARKVRLTGHIIPASRKDGQEKHQGGRIGYAA